MIRCRCLLGVLQRKLKLVLGQALGPPTKAMTLELANDLAQRECQLNCVRAFHGRLSLADCSRQTLCKEDGELRVGGSPLDGGLPVDTKIPQRQVEQLGGRLI